MSFELRSSNGSDAILSPEIPKPLPWQRANQKRWWKLKSPLKRFVASRIVRTLICTTTAWTIAYTYCKHSFWRDPESYFFNEKHVYDLQYSQHRQDIAWNFMDTLNATSPKQEPAANPVICIGMVTVKRKQKMDYLNATIGSMLVGLTAEERSAINIQLLFADPDPAQHPEWNKEWLKAVDYYSGYNVSEEKFEEIKRWEEKTIQMKGVYDYIYIPEQCVNHTNAPYIAVFEDDLIFADGWLAKTITALGKIRQKGIDWLYLRLFYVDRFGFDKLRDRWYTNPTPWMCLSISIVVVVTLVLQAGRKRVNPNSDTSVQLTVGCIAIPLFILLIRMIGRNSLIPDPAEGLRRMDRKGCCTQALIDPRHQVPNVTTLLREKVKGQTDLLIEKWAHDFQLPRYAVVPQVVQHIGLISTRGLPKRLAKATWAFFFEASNPKQLRKEHEELTKWGIWRATRDS